MKKEITELDLTMLKGELLEEIAKKDLSSFKTTILINIGFFLLALEIVFILVNRN